MDTLDTFRRRIQNAVDMRSVVRTMKTLSAVAIRQYESAVDSLVEYDRTIEIGFGMLLRDRQPTPRPRRGAAHRAAIVIGSGQGMCGQFDEDIVAFFVDHVRKASDERRGPAMAIGHRLRGALHDLGFDTVDAPDLPGSLVGITPLIQTLLPVIEGWTRREGVTHVDLFHHRRLTAATCRPRHVRLLPPDLQAFATAGRRLGRSRTLPRHTADFETLLHALVRQYLFVALFRACAESLASEHAARISAMQSAEKSIDRRLGELRADYNRFRQTAITEEILDVVTGYEALVTGKGRATDRTRPG